MLGAECCGRSFGGFFRGLKLRFFLLQFRPLLIQRNEAVALRRRRRCRRGRIFDGGAVGFEFLLDDIFGIAADTDQFLASIGDFVLVQLEIGFGEIEVVVELFFARAAGFGFGSSEGGDLLSVGIQGVLEISEALLHFFGFGAQRGRIVADLLKRRGEGEADGVVREAESFLRKALFTGTVGKLSERQRGGEGRFVDDEIGGKSRLGKHAGTQGGKGFVGAVEAKDSKGKQDGDDDSSEFLRFAHELVVAGRRTL